MKIQNNKKRTCMHKNAQIKYNYNSKCSLVGRRICPWKPNLNVKGTTLVTIFNLPLADMRELAYDCVPQFA